MPCSTKYRITTQRELRREFWQTFLTYRAKKSPTIPATAPCIQPTPVARSLTG